MSEIIKVNLLNYPLSELRSLLKQMGEPDFRVTQIIKWIYQKRVSSFDEMKNLSKEFRAKLADKYTVLHMPRKVVQVSKYNNAVKFGFELIDSSDIVECVLLLDGKRRTACLSSQLGCGLGCKFCQTAKLGFVRNLTLAEIIGQVIGIEQYLTEQGDKPLTNIVFMGMGEALSNFDTFISSLEIIMDENCFAIGGRKITVSTAGVIPSIEKLLLKNFNIGLAISLNSYSDEKRTLIMPINATYPIASLVAIAKKYFVKTGRRVTFEYVVIKGVTDTFEAANALHTLLGSFPCKLNLIPVNPADGIDYCPPNAANLEKFAEELTRLGLAVTLRHSRGADIRGACGQLTAQMSNNQKIIEH